MFPPRFTLRRLTAFALVALTAARGAAQTTVSVPGDANIYGAGFGTPPSPNGFGGGSLPVLYSLSGGATTITISNVSGSVSFNNSFFNGADGGTGFGALTQESAYNSLSGITYTGRTDFLVGVFLDASTPTGTEPATLSYDNTSAGASSFSPLLRQVFFVGDGLDSNAATQSFNVPSGATRLYFGFADSWNGSSITGPPGNYSDNAGSLSVTITSIPEPASGAFACGIGALALARRQRRKT